MGLALPDRITHLNGICFKLNVTEFSEISCFLLLKMKTPWSKWQSEVKSQDFEALQRTWSLTGTPTWAMPLSSLFWCTNILEPCWCCKDCPLLGTANDWPASAPPLGKLTDQTHTPAPVSGTTWVGTASKCHKQAHPKPGQPASPPTLGRPWLPRVALHDILLHDSHFYAWFHQNLSTLTTIPVFEIIQITAVLVS